jgi:heme ABC exporter ATP-binding subunit CcmA
MTTLVETATALSATGIVRRWGDSEVLRGADMALERGARAFLGGRNGAGKTTLLRICAGLVEPNAGDVRLSDLHPVRDRRRYQSQLGYLPAGNGGLYARLTVRQNLEFWASLALLAGARRTAAVNGAVAAFELEPMERSRVDRISMGQRQRVRLAMTFLHEPSVVLLDEPHTSLDDEALALLRTALDSHHDRGGTTLWCAPSSTQAEIDADVSFWVEDGLVRRG